MFFIHKMTYVGFSWMDIEKFREKLNKQLEIAGILWQFNSTIF